MRALAETLVVLRKELVDALRDRRTLLAVLLGAVLVGPLALLLLSGLVGQFEEQAEQRVVVAAGLAQAPTLRNYLERQGYALREAPPDHEAQLRERRLAEPVLVVAPGFEDALARGEPAALTIVSDSGNRRAEAGSGRLAQLLEGFARERGTLALALRGVPPALLRPLDVQERDLAGARERGAQFTAMLPFFVLMAVLYGALNAALDTTAGERERGSLEPLLANPAAPLALVLGKWGAVATVGMLVALLSVASFLPAQWLIRSETLRALFVFGPREAALFLVLLLPLAAALSALMMAVAIGCRSVKEAQAANTGVILAASLLPLVTLYHPGGEQGWFLWVPALAQSALMNRVLRGEALAAGDVALACAVSAAIAVLALAGVARRLRTVAAR
ncbi:MAG TPA: ABC transporter permease subunit [Methylibium sp.]|nr:ABC transporter permease subunit [Methylibium sp.]